MFQANLPGFEPYRMAASADEPLQVLVRSMITRNLGEYPQMSKIFSAVVRV
jgi:hypothetical protein